MNSTNVTVDEKAILRGVNAEVEIVFGVVGRMIQEHAAASMKPHQVQTVRQRNGASRTSFVGRTPDGSPPQKRSGDIANNIRVAQQDATVLIGPVALPAHDTDCLARLEYGQHPFMQPALDAVAPTIPQVWQQSIIG